MTITLQLKTYLNKEAINPEINVSSWLNIVCNLCQSDIAKLIARENGFNICKCLKCGLVYVNPQPSNEDLVNYYTHYYPKISEETIDQWEQTKSFNQALEIIEKYYPQGGKLLDVGCGLGLFLEKVDKRKWKLDGLDLDSKAIKYSSRRNKHISFIFGDITDSALIPDNSYNVVTVLACLEHQTDPMKTLKRIYQILKPGGRAIFRVPYIAPWIYLNKYLNFLPVKFQAPMHLYDFTPDVLKSILGKSGYKNIEILIAAPDNVPGTLNRIIVNSIKWFSRLLYFITGNKYIFPLSGGLLGIGEKRQ